MNQQTNIFGAVQQVMKQMGNMKPEDFLKSYVQSHNVPQNILNQAQEMASNALPTVRNMFKK